MRPNKLLRNIETPDLLYFYRFIQQYKWFSNFSGLRPTLDYDKFSRPTGL
ncbi:hypothetical protein T12_6890 [Trichinella patagoniensis]|uniref:Uncharacterized protein n=1 Tax=Trichinella patagoniensis TaxID=990121 RepID=A0A0V0YS93_9BILA|nr:hypothetical protein T12_6890 [Trichinella patagoniensis]